MLIRRFPYQTQLGLEQQLREMERMVRSLSRGSAPGGGPDDRGGPPDTGSSVSGPATDVYEHDGELVIEVELPGFDIENDVAVSVDGGVLSIAGQRSSERSTDDDGCYIVERRSGRFSRSFSLPDGIGVDEIGADYSDGVLTVRMPLPTDVDDEPRRIEIGKGRSSSAVPIEEAGDGTGDTDDTSVETESVETGTEMSESKGKTPPKQSTTGGGSATKASKKKQKAGS